MSAPALPRFRIVYFVSIGSQVANALLQLFAALNQEVLLVVTTPGPPTRPMTGYKDIVANIPPGVDVLVTSHIKRLARMLAPLEPDLIFVSGFPWRFPADLLALPRL